MKHDKDNGNAAKPGSSTKAPSESVQPAKSAMVTHVDGLMSMIPQYKKTWSTQGVQAAWRLGWWDLMDEYLNGANEEGLLYSSSESNVVFDMDVAKILQAIMKKEQFSVGERIAIAILKLLCLVPAESVFL